ncbi:MAG TPA: TIGR03435 family protein [Bryobacteraceae bacterium]|nr:TIGR03435 family protein [Bryobacteraceae bacterium]
MIRTASLIALAACAAFAQPAAAPAAFEVASVKRADGGASPGDIPRNMDKSPGHFAMHNVPLRFCLEWAYDLKDYEISGPDWIKVDERYDIIAKASGPASDDEMRPMLQRLLTERFQMKLHREPKEMSVYVLVPGKGPAKVKEAASDGQPSLSGGPSGATFTNQPISRLTFLLTRRMQRPVLDLTGLKGLYTYTLDLSGLPNMDTQPVENGPVPSIFAAIQNDLGLKMEARKMPIGVLVIDQVSKIPIEN